MLALRVLVPSSVLRETTVAAIRQGIERECYWIAFQVYLRDRALTSIRIIAVGDTAFGGVPGQNDLFAATVRPENLVLNPADRTPTREDLATFYDRSWWCRFLAM